MGTVIGIRVAIRVNRVEQRLCQHPGVADAICVKHTQRDDARTWSHHADQASNVRAVTVARVGRCSHFRRVIVVVNKVKTGEQPASKQRVGVIDTGVENCHANADARRQRLCFGKTHGLRCPLGRISLRGTNGPGNVFARFWTAMGRIGLGNHHVGIKRHAG